MPERIGMVLSTGGDKTAEVVTDRKGACGGCQDDHGCRSCLGSSGNKMISTVQNIADAGPGDVVVIHQSASALWTGATLLYLLPIFGLIVGAAIGSGITTDDGLNDSTWAVIIGFFGLALGFLVTFFIARSPGGRDRLMPRIIQIVEKAESPDHSAAISGTRPNGGAACCGS